MLQVFEGMATSKKQAMQVAAKEALEVLGNVISSSAADAENMTPTKISPAGKVQLSVASGKNPVMIINEVYPDAEYGTVSESGDGVDKTFMMSVCVEGQTFSGSGRSKRLAKAHAAQAALSQIHGVVCLASPGQSLIVSINVKNYYFKHSCNDYNDIRRRKPQKLAYDIFKCKFPCVVTTLCLKKFGARTLCLITQANMDQFQ